MCIVESNCFSFQPIQPEQINHTFSLDFFSPYSSCRPHPFLDHPLVRFWRNAWKHPNQKPQIHITERCHSSTFFIVEFAFELMWSASANNLEAEKIRVRGVCQKVRLLFEQLKADVLFHNMPRTVVWRHSHVYLLRRQRIGPHRRLSNFSGRSRQFILDWVVAVGNSVQLFAAQFWYAKTVESLKLNHFIATRHRIIDDKCSGIAFIYRLNVNLKRTEWIVSFVAADNLKWTIEGSVLLLLRIVEIEWLRVFYLNWDTRRKKIVQNNTVNQQMKLLEWLQ